MYGKPGGGTASVPIVRAALAGALVRCGRWRVLAPRLYGWGAALTKDGFSCGKNNSIRRPQNRTKKDIMELFIKTFLLNIYVLQHFMPVSCTARIFAKIVCTISLFL